MNQESANLDKWDACPPGELRRMVRQMEVRQRRQVLKQVGGVAAALVVVGAGGYLAGDWLFGPPGGITCDRAMHFCENFRPDELNAEQRRKVFSHLDGCAKCGPKYAKWRAASLGAAGHRRRASFA